MRSDSNTNIENYYFYNIDLVFRCSNIYDEFEYVNLNPYLFYETYSDYINTTCCNHKSDSLDCHCSYDLLNNN